MNHLTYLTPGPSELYFTVADHIRTVLREKLLSISHRSETFKSIYGETIQELRTLLTIPEDYEIVFTSSANEVWERLLQNCVDERSLHFVNGAFSEKFYKFAQQLQLHPEVNQVDWGKGFIPEDYEILENIELVALALNETSTGVKFPLESIQTIRAQYPESLLAIDATSALPSVELPVEIADAVYFSVQKAFGLPAGLGVWIVSPRALERTETREKQGKVLGTYHRLSELVKKSRQNQTPETPNILGIYLLGKVCADLNQRGIEQIRRETTYKSTLLYHKLEQHTSLLPFVKEKRWRSDTVIVADCLSEEQTASVWKKQLLAKGFEVGQGYGKLKNKQLRFANFPTHSRETLERFVDLL